MSHTNRNFVIAYILLVGLPLAGLAGVLRSGRSLTAPISVDGSWKLEADSIHSSGQSCDKALSSLSPSSFSISQSGKSLMLTLNNPAKTTAEGSLEGKVVKAQVGTTDSSTAGCTAGQPLLLMATVDPKSEPRSLAGVLSVNGCSSCGSVEFRAVRQPKIPSGAGH
jgi:hypothetical protein